LTSVNISFLTAHFRLFVTALSAGFSVTMYLHANCERCR